MGLSARRLTSLIPKLARQGALRPCVSASRASAWEFMLGTLLNRDTALKRGNMNSSDKFEEHDMESSPQTNVFGI